uniref:Apple domain-containing protein n=1 Tax=Ascaris lumbricoides TaxID=6252 RepID=A0A0M3HEY4_ASCLU
MDHFASCPYVIGVWSYLQMLSKRQCRVMVHVVQTWAYLATVKGCAQKSYFIESERLIEGGIIEKIHSTSIHQCIEQCSKIERCSALNFLLDMELQPICLLMDTTAPVVSSELPIPESVMYSAVSFCMQPSSLQCAHVMWSFEKYSNRAPLSADYMDIVENVHRVDECLSHCAQRYTCKAALFNRRTQTCYVSPITVQNVYNVRKYFAVNPNIDLYESNCASYEEIDSTRCHFLRVHSAGFTDIFDVRLQQISDVDACERACLSWTHGVCRSFTFDRTDNSCYLSHTTGRALGKNPLDMTNVNLSTGDLDDCFKFKLKCKSNSLQLWGSSMKIFSGTIKAKTNRDTFCEKSIKNAYEFETEMNYGECGMQKSSYPYPTFTSVIVLKEGSTDLITIRDKIIQVNCRMHQNLEVLPDQVLSFRLEIEDENTTRKLITESIRLASSSSDFVPRPKYTLEVLDASGQLTDIVNVGDFGYLLVTGEKMESNFVVCDVAARDIKSDRVIPLIDSDGCVIDKRISSFKRIGNNQLRMRIEFSGFTDHAEVVYEGIVKSCTQDCYPKCNSDLWQTDDEPRAKSNQVNRSRRVSRYADSSRRFELSEDIYTLRSINKLTIIARSVKDSRSDKNTLSYGTIEEKTSIPNGKDGYPQNGDSNVSWRKVAMPSYMRCICDDFSCLFTVLLVCVQVLLIISGIGVACIYIRQWKQYRRRQQEQLNDIPIQYEFTVTN